MLIFVYIFSESSTVKSVTFCFKLKTIHNTRACVVFCVVGMCLNTKSRYSLLDRSFFAKIDLPVLKLFTPNFASFRLSDDALQWFTCFSFRKPHTYLLFAFFPFFMRFILLEFNIERV